MPIIQAFLLEGRDDEKKAAFIAAVTDAAVSTLDAPRETVRVIITEIPPTHFGIGGESVAARRKIQNNK